MQYGMDFPNAIRALAGNPQMRALRWGGPVLLMTSRNLVVDVRNGTPRPYAGKFSDYVGIDWEVMTIAQLAEVVKKAQAARMDS